MSNKKEPTPIDYNDDFQYVMTVLENSEKSLFVTGRAGTGKSTLLRLFRDTSKKKVVTLAPTGIAALNIGGQTIHSFFSFPAKVLNRSKIQPRRNKRLFKKVKTIIIDEVSMVRADMMDNIDYFLRINREDPRPFGGVQMVFFGDLFQLPPVISTEEEHELMASQYESPYFFSAKVFKEYPFETVQLYKVYRQNNRNFIKLLDRVRMNQIDYDDLETLNERCIPDVLADDFYITLATTNLIVNQLNEKRLKKLLSPEVVFTARISGEFSGRAYPTDDILRLKDGAQVMFVKNDSKRRFVNGTIGKIISLTQEQILVEILNENGTVRQLEVEREEWEILKYELNAKGEIESKVKGTFKQYPLRLAWAITIHKSQGKTFEKIIINLGRGAFAAGQTYVALSRCTSLQGIILKTPVVPRDIMIDERIIDFFESTR
ncbi:MAG: ATP-dependent DNA helicase [Saprospiraceae bacterium]